MLLAADTDHVLIRENSNFAQQLILTNMIALINISCLAQFHGRHLHWLLAVMVYADLGYRFAWIVYQCWVYKYGAEPLQVQNAPQHEETEERENAPQEKEPAQEKEYKEEAVEEEAVPQHEEIMEAVEEEAVPQHEEIMEAVEEPARENAPQMNEPAQAKEYNAAVQEALQENPQPSKNSDNPYVIPFVIIAEAINDDSRLEFSYNDKIALSYKDEIKLRKRGALFPEIEYYMVAPRPSPNRKTCIFEKSQSLRELYHDHYQQSYRMHMAGD